MSWFSRLRNALHPRRLDDDLADEMADHVLRRADALGQKGLDGEEALQQARLRFGNTTRVREQSRGIRLWAALEGTLQDVRYAWRGMRKGPAFTATAVLSLSLAIAANTAVYSIVDAAILRPLPVHEPDQLFTLTWPGISDPGGPDAEERVSFSYPVYLEFVAVSKGTARLAIFSGVSRVEVQRPNADAPIERIGREFVSGEAFDILGVTPALGRLFSAEQDRLPPSRNVAVLSYDFWRRHFHTDPAIIGQVLKIDGKNYEITGVTREGFVGVEPGKFVDVWVPATSYSQTQAFTEAGWHWFRIVGRLVPGVSPLQLSARLEPSFHRFQVESVKRNPTIPPAIRKQILEAAVRVRPAGTGVSDFRRVFSRPLWIVFGVAAGILFIACANIASLLLARATARASEMAMRVSLGAARTRLIRQLLTESLLLSLLAGAAGWLLARAIAPLLVHMLSTQNDPVQFILPLNSRVLFFAIGVSTVSAVFFGLLPAWQASSTQPMFSLRASSGQAGKLRLGKAFVSVQVACAFCLILVGGAFLFTLGNLLRVNPGFDPRNVALVSITTEAGKKPEPEQRELMSQLQRRVASQAGITGAALAMWPIFDGAGWSEQIMIPGKAPSDREEIFYRVSAGYFSTLRTPLLAGRDFTLRDGPNTEPIPAIVNEAFARKYFPGQDPLGKEFGRPGEHSAVRHLIVGLASDTHYYDLRRSVDPIVYLPMEGQSWFSLYVRSPLSVGSVVRVVDREAQAIGSGTR
ncbi:MAG TPA: ABC transporter permease, partial [Bryobacteraceae bacterium]|nr:ABC transporter permease [Bryobacteraceae bacterium]